MTESRYLAPLIPKEYGGLGLGLAETTIILEEINRSGGNGLTINPRRVMINNETNELLWLVGGTRPTTPILLMRFSKSAAEMLAPHRKNRKKKKTRDGRKLRRYKRRWKIECLFA